MAEENPIAKDPRCSKKKIISRTEKWCLSKIIKIRCDSANSAGELFLLYQKKKVCYLLLYLVIYIISI